MTSRTVAIVFGALLCGFGALEFVPALTGCGIKGNINVSTQQRIYHMPGQKYYFVTRINPLLVERRFCSGSAARAAGLRKVRV